MNHTILGKVFSLINKTGDRCIVLSEEHNEAYAVMSLVEYERLTIGKSEVASLTEDELLDRINRDIAVWKSQQEADRSAGEADSAGYDSGPKMREWEEEDPESDLEDIRERGLS